MPEAGRPRRSGSAIGYDQNVFINCPFDSEYKPLFDALVFAVHACGFLPRCALEAADSWAVRVEKIVQIIRECRFGIHDISRTELNREGLPRFNMPYELGLFMGAQRLGDAKQRRKSCLILDREPYRYQAFLSDIAGQDPQSHGNDPMRAVKETRSWLWTETRREESDPLPGAAVIQRRFAEFQSDAPTLAERHLFGTEGERTFADYTALVSMWLREALSGRVRP
jgi:hypothetical protein